MDESYSFICLNNDGYDGLRRPRHILMNRLARMGFRVLFVSSAVNYISQRFSRPHLKMGGMKRLGRRFYWYQPPAFLPQSDRLLLGKFVLAVRMLLLRATITILSRRPRIFFVTVPDRDYINILKAYPKETVVYNVHDRYVDAAGYWIEGHDELMQRADTVLCGSQALMMEMRKLYEKPIFFFPPGVDFDLFPRDHGFVPRRKGEKIVAACVGNLGGQIDWRLLSAVAGAAEHIEFLLVGPLGKDTPSDPSFQNLQQLPNVTVVGQVAHDQIPDIVNGADICLMPYALSEYTVGVNPLKMYEYLALGKPVVSSPIPSVRAFMGLIYVAFGPDEWINCLERAVAENDEEKFQARRRFALEQDYDSRIAMLMTLLRPDRSGLLAEGAHGASNQKGQNAAAIAIPDAE